jgi:hypothetical protein
MNQYDDTNRGALFKNDRKESDNHPDYKGKINIEGVDYWLSAWIKTDKNGAKYMSLSPQRKDQGQQQKPQQQQQRTGGQRDDFDQDVPFAPLSAKLPI